MTVEDLVEILKLKDDTFDDIFQCSVEEFVQFLIQNVDNERYYMMGHFVNNALSGYLIGVDSVFPPVNWSVNIIYYKSCFEDSKKVLEDLKEWGKEKGAQRISFITTIPDKFKKHGFEEKSIMMSMEL